MKKYLRELGVFAVDFIKFIGYMIVGTVILGGFVVFLLWVLFK